MSDATNALVISKPACPLCESKARREIDALIYARSQVSAVRGFDAETGEDAIPSPDEPELLLPSYDTTLVEIKELLSKIPDNGTAEFGLTDLIIHASRHPLITQVRGVPLRSEGEYLWVGDAVYKSPDLKDFLGFVIAKAAEQIQSGELKITPTFALNATALRWRMTGNSGDDPLMQGIREVVTKRQLDASSPLGKAYSDRQLSITQGDRDIPLIVPEEIENDSDG